VGKPAGHCSLEVVGVPGLTASHFVILKGAPTGDWLVFPVSTAAGVLTLRMCNHGSGADSPLGEIFSFMALRQPMIERAVSARPPTRKP
jgi:hypothetical protein